jgi:predicted ATPase/Tfp pilus assembly protein PilF
MDNIELISSFGEWIKFRRKSLDLTQEELSQRVGCSIFALRKIESGERRPSKQLAALLGQALDLSNNEQRDFIRAARGELSFDRLRATRSKPQTRDSGSQSIYPSEYPLPPTPLLGRDAELDAIERLFQSSQCRLLTLTGLGGIGKTRLALEFVAKQQKLFPGGIFYTPLAAVDSAEMIIPAIAEALKYTFSGSFELKEQLVKFLLSRSTEPFLLALDNFEHLLQLPPADSQKTNGVGIVVDLLERLPNAKILITSRERLNLHGEWVYEIHGLPFPSQEFTGRLEQYSAAALFIQCARRAQVDFEVCANEQSSIIKICQILEGIPLAIELAAAWVGTLGCEEIAREIQLNIDFLTTSMVNIPERHRSLKASFDHSWKLLSDFERDALCRLAIFQGGFDRLAATEVAGADLPLLASLVSKSLVRRSTSRRYDIHEVVRQYALSHSDECFSPIAETRDRHCLHYLRMVAGCEKALKSSAQQTAFRDLSIEMDNIRAAWGWAIENELFTLLGNSARSLGWIFEVAGLLGEGIEQFEKLIRALREKPENHPFLWVLGLAFTQQGLLTFRKGQFTRAKMLFEEALATLRAQNRRDLSIDALVYLGVIMHLNGELEYAKVLFEEGIQVAKTSGDDWFTAYAIYNLGYVESLDGNFVRAYEEMAQGLSIWRQLGDPYSLSLGYNFFTQTLIRLGKFEEAQTYLRESLRLCSETNNRWGMGTVYRYLGLLALAQGDLTEAQSFFHQSLHTFGDYVIGWDIARTYTYLGDSVTRSGNLDEAKEIYLAGLRVAKESNSIPLMLRSFAGLAYCALQSGELGEAELVAEYVFSHPSSDQENREMALEIIARASEILSEEEILRIRSEVKNLSFDAIYNKLA